MFNVMIVWAAMVLSLILPDLLYSCDFFSNNYSSNSVISWLR